MSSFKGRSALRLSPFVAEGLAAAPWPVIVTGATGWLGRAALMALDDALGAAMPGRVQAYASTARDVTLPSGRVVAMRPYATLEDAPGTALILHFAFRTKGYAAEPGYVETNRAIAVRMQAFIRRNGAVGLFVPSSGAVYGPGRVPRQTVADDPYGALKYEDEQRFQALAAGLGVPAVVMRIFNLGGPGINNIGGYALSSIIADIFAGGPVRLRAARPVVRSYVHVGDVLELALSLLLRGQSPAVFDTAGEREIEVGGLAALAVQLLAGSLQIERPAGWADGVADRYLGDGAAFARLAAEQGIAPRGLERQILDTADDMRRVAPA